jgi:hypothetical protein
MGSYWVDTIFCLRSRALTMGSTLHAVMVKIFTVFLLSFVWSLLTVWAVFSLYILGIQVLPSIIALEAQALETITEFPAVLMLSSIPFVVYLFLSGLTAYLFYKLNFGRWNMGYKLANVIERRLKRQHDNRNKRAAIP